MKEHKSCVVSSFCISDTVYLYVFVSGVRGEVVNKIPWRTSLIIADVGKESQMDEETSQQFNPAGLSCLSLH